MPTRAPWFVCLRSRVTSSIPQGCSSSATGLRRCQAAPSWRTKSAGRGRGAEHPRFAVRHALSSRRRRRILRLCVVLSEGGFSSVGHLDPLLVRRGLGVVVVVPVPPLVRRGLWITLGRV